MIISIRIKELLIDVMAQNKRLYDRIVSFTSSDFFGMTSDLKADISSQKVFLESIKEPKDDFERSFAQYKCQRFLRNKFSLFLLNAGCALMLIPYIIKCRLKKVPFVEQKEAVFALAEKDQGKIPTSLKEKYPNARYTIQHEVHSMNSFDMKFIGELFRRYPFSPYFILHILYKLTIYRGFIEKYSPKVLIVSEEFSCVSSTLTQYCERQGIVHINVMHGEKDFYIRDSFFRFHKCYVWDEYYIDLFKSLRADKSEYVVEVPESFLMHRQEGDSAPNIDYKYMLFENEQLEGIAKTLHQLKEKGFSIIVRPHPSFTDLDKVRKFFTEDEIEPNSVPVDKSVLDSKYVISLYSTVLLQAYLSGVSVVIDDINYPNEFSRLKDLRYILIEKDHKILSEVLRS